MIPGSNPSCQPTGITAWRISPAIWRLYWDWPGNRPAILLGHSIGGMITLHLAAYPQFLGARVKAIALAETTYTNPVRTANMARFLTALERPVIVPLLHLTYGCHRWSGRRI